MKRLRSIAIGIAVFILSYVGAFWVYFHTDWINLDTITKPSMKRAAVRSLEFVFHPCIEWTVWREREKEKQEERERYYGVWKASFGSAEMEIREDGAFSLRSGDQNLTGRGAFEIVGGSQCFRVNTSCRYAKNEEGKAILPEDLSDREVFAGHCSIVVRADVYQEAFVPYDPNHRQAFVEITTEGDPELDLGGDFRNVR